MKWRFLLVAAFLCMSMTFGVPAEETEEVSYEISSNLLTGRAEDEIVREIVSIYPEADIWSVFHSKYNFDIVPDLRFGYSSNDTYLSFSNYSLLLLYTGLDGERKNFKLGNSMVSTDGSFSFITYDSMCEALKGIYEFDLAVIKDL
jgi:hypothetical protein